jgi:hypothetical protein
MGEIGFRLSFSEGYKSQGVNVKTGCLKIYQSSPIADRGEIEKVVKQLVSLKEKFDGSCDKLFEEQKSLSSDFVYR